jgi:hypothetical protein
MSERDTGRGAATRATVEQRSFARTGLYHVIEGTGCKV